MIPRFVPNTHAPAFSPANYRFARVWATSDSSAQQSALLHIPRSFEYAGSIGSESSIWSDTSSWVSVSSLRTAPSEVRTPLLHQPPAPSASSFFQNDPDKLHRNSLRPSSVRSSVPSSDLESPKRPSFRYPPALSESVSEDAIVDDLLSRPSDLPHHHATQSRNHSKNQPSSTRLPSESPLNDLAVAKPPRDPLNDSLSMPRISDKHREIQPRESNASRPSRPDRTRQPANRSSFLPALTRKRRSLWQWLFCSDTHAHSSVASARLPPCTVERPRDQPLAKPARPSKNQRASKADRDVSGLSHPKPDPRVSTRRRRSPSFEIRRGKPAQAEQSRRSLSWSLVPRAILGLGTTPEKARNSKERRRKSVSSKPVQRGPVPPPDAPNSPRVSYQKQNQPTRRNHHETNGSRQQSGHGRPERIRSSSSKGRSRESSKDERVRRDHKADTSRGPTEHHRENGRERTRDVVDNKKTQRPPSDRPRNVPPADPRGLTARKASSGSTRNRDASPRVPGSGTVPNRVGSDMSARSHPRSSSNSGVSGRDERKVSASGSDKTAPTSRQISNVSSNKSSKPGYRTPSNTSQKLSNDGRQHQATPPLNTPPANTEGQVGTLALAEGMLNGLFPPQTRGSTAANVIPSGGRQPTSTSRGSTKPRQGHQVSPQLSETAGRPRAASPSMQAKLFAFPSSSSEGSTGQDGGKLRTNVWEEPPVITNRMAEHLRMNGNGPAHIGPKGALGTDSKRRHARMPEAVARAMEKNRARSNGGPLSYLTKHHETEADTNTGSTGLTSLADESVSTHKTVSITGEEYMYVEDPIHSGRRNARENSSMDYRVGTGGSTTPSIFQSSALFNRSRSPISGGGGASPRRFHSDWSDPHATDIDVYCQCNCSCVYEEECRRSCDLIYGRSPSVSSTKSCGRKAISGGLKAPPGVVDETGRKWNSRVEGGDVTATPALSGGGTVPAVGSGSGQQPRSGTPGKPQRTMMRANTVDELPDVDSGRRLVPGIGYGEELVAGRNFGVEVNAEDKNVGKQRVRVPSSHSEERARSPYVDSGRLSREAANDDGKSSMEARVAAATVAALERRREQNGRSNGIRGSGSRVSSGAKNGNGQNRDNRRRTSGTHGDGTNGHAGGAGTGQEYPASRANGHGDVARESYLASRDLVRTFSNDGMIEKNVSHLGRSGGRAGNTAVKAGKDERNGQTRGMRRSGRTGARQRASLFGIF